MLLDVSVKDAAGEHISNLSKDDFRVYEDGKVQKITQFASEDVPVTVGLVIDTSASMRPKYREVFTAAVSFIQASNRHDEVFVVNFGDRVTSGLPGGVPFTADLRPASDGPVAGTSRGPDGSLRRDSVLPASSRERHAREEDPDAGQRRRRQ